MLTTLYTLCALALFALLILVLRLDWKKRHSYLMVLGLVLFGLLYDNLILALGSSLGPGTLLEDLSFGRFIGHALGTPLLSIFAFGILRRAGINWAQKPVWHAALCLFTTLLVFLGMYSALFLLKLSPRAVADFFMYTGTDSKVSFLPAALTILILLGFGAALWKQNHWPWLFVAALTMLLAAILGLNGRFYLNNVGEVLLAWGCVETASHFWPLKAAAQAG